MNQLEQEKCWIAQAVSGDQDALEALLCSVQDMVFNLSCGCWASGQTQRTPPRRYLSR